MATDRAAVSEVGMAPERIGSVLSVFTLEYFGTDGFSSVVDSFTFTAAATDQYCRFSGYVDVDFSFNRALVTPGNLVPPPGRQSDGKTTAGSDTS